MIYAAGVMFMTPKHEVLLVRRSAQGDHAGEWAFPGGKIEDGEDAEEAVKRECQEELGTYPPGVLMPHTRSISPDNVDYTTFVQIVPEKFQPTLNDEHVNFSWSTPYTAPEPLHPGCQVSIDRLVMHEMDAAEAVRDGRLSSPHKFENVWLFALRVTGTGAAYRGKAKEFVKREKELYLNDGFLKRCNGLPVIFDHPEKTVTLTSEEFKSRVIGSIMLPYIQDEDVWGIARIYDAVAAKRMSEEQLSTSPCVAFDRFSGNRTHNLQDGSSILVEGESRLLDHLAVCTLGVWDKYGPPTGVLNETLRLLERADSMATENTPEALAALIQKTIADSQKAYADSTAPFHAKLDSALDNFAARLTAIEARADAAEEEKKADKAKADAAKADAEDEDKKADAARADKAKADADEHEQWKKDDAEMCAKDDAQEAEDCKDMESKGETKEVAADKARSKRKDSMKARADAVKADKAKADAEMTDEPMADSAARADAAAAIAKADAAVKEAAELRARIAALEGHNEPQTADTIQAFSDAQTELDRVYSAHGQRAEAPLRGESLLNYRLRLARPLQKFSTKWKDFDLRAMGAELLGKVVFKEVFADAMAASNAPTDIPAGQLRMISIVDPATGARRNEFRGPPGENFIGHMRNRSPRAKFNPDRIKGA